MTCRVYLESPYNGTPEEIRANVEYAQRAVRDCLERGEAPFASHLLYTQCPGAGFVSDDDDTCVSIGREAAMDAAFAWRAACEKTVVYIDRGISAGMQNGIDHANEIGCSVEYRSLERDYLRDAFRRAYQNGFPGK